MSLTHQAIGQGLPASPRRSSVRVAAAALLAVAVRIVYLNVFWYSPWLNVQPWRLIIVLYIVGIFLGPVALVLLLRWLRQPAPALTSALSYLTLFGVGLLLDIPGNLTLEVDVGGNELLAYAWFGLFTVAVVLAVSAILNWCIAKAASARTNKSGM